MVPLPSLMAHWRKRSLEWGQKIVTNGGSFWNASWIILPVLVKNSIRFFILFRVTTTIKETLSPGLWHDAVHMRKQRGWLEESKCIAAMQMAKKTVKVCVSLLSTLCLELVQHVSVRGGSSKCWKLSCFNTQHCRAGRMGNHVSNPRETRKHEAPVSSQHLLRKSNFLQLLPFTHSIYIYLCRKS